MNVSISVMPRNIHTYTQNKALNDVFGLTWPKFVRRENGYIEVGVTLNQSCCHGYHDYDSNIHLKLCSIKHYLVHILAKFWASLAYINRISTLQTFGHSQD